MIRSTFLCFLVLLSACGKKDEAIDTTQDSAAYALESATALLGSLANDAENSSSLVSRDLATMAECSIATARSTCDGNIITVSWPNCTLPLGNANVTLSGGWRNTYNDGVACTTARSGGLASGDSFTRTYLDFGITFPLGRRLTTSSNAHSAYDGTAIPATGVTVTNVAGTRQITIQGLRRILAGSKGAKFFDHSITSSAISVTGTRAAGTRLINSGNLTVYHNIVGYKAVSSFSNVRWGEAGCCFPTSGRVTTTFTGSLVGNAELAFGPSCGAATFTDTKGSSEAISLSQCE
jgi:hypothetical protein